MLIESVGKYVGAKVVTATVFVGSAGAVIWFWNHPEQLEQIWQVIKYALIWLGVVALLPWATFFVTTTVVAKDSNAAAGLMLGGYALIDVLVAFGLIGGVSGLDSLTWFVLLIGFLAAGVYNYVVCDYIATRLEEG